MAWTASVVTYCRAQDSTTPFAGGLTNNSIDYPVSQAPESLLNGTGADQIDLGFGDSRSYDTTGVTWDLTSIAKASTNTNAATFTAVKYVATFNEGATNDITWGNAASVQFTPGFSAATTTVTIQEGGHIAFFNPTAAGWDVTTNKNLKIVAAASTTTGTLIVLGED